MNVTQPRPYVGHLSYNGVDRIAIILGDDERNEDNVFAYQLSPQVGYRCFAKLNIERCQEIDIPDDICALLQPA